MPTGAATGSAPATWFAPPERLGAGEIGRYAEVVSRSPVIDGLLTTVSGLLAILNETRQVVAVNEKMLARFGIQSVGELLGLRLGQVIDCEHAAEGPAGCGTTKFCSSCGAAVAIVSALGGREPCERNCAISVCDGGESRDLCLNVRACPIACDGIPLVLLFMQDITNDVQRASLEHVFFHDVSNMVRGLQALAEAIEPPAAPAGTVSSVERLRAIAQRLAREVEFQRVLAYGDDATYHLTMAQVACRDVLDVLRALAGTHPAGAGKRLEVEGGETTGLLRTDRLLLERILSNMVINALEACEAGDAVRLAVQCDAEQCEFSVWNRAPVPDEMMNRMFQRNYSTKAGSGRGLGTFSMRLFAERYLGGRVTFTSTAAEGTTFRLVLPRVPPVPV